MNGTETDCHPVPGIDGRDQHGQVNRLGFRQLDTDCLIDVVRRDGFHDQRHRFVLSGVYIVPVVKVHLGGVGTFFGPVLGAGIVIALQDNLADKVGEWVTVIIGAIFVVCVLAFRKGIVGEFIAWRARRR